MRKYQKEYYINNKELIKEYAKNKYNSLAEDKKQKIKDYQKQYRKNNPLKEDRKQKMREYQKEYYINNKESIKEHAKNKYKFLTEDKKQKMKDYQKRYREAKKINIFLHLDFFTFNNYFLCLVIIKDYKYF